MKAAVTSTCLVGQAGLGTEAAKGRLESVTGTWVSRMITFRCMPFQYPFVGQVICRVWFRL